MTLHRPVAIVSCALAALCVAAAPSTTPATRPAAARVAAAADAIRRTGDADTVARQRPQKDYDTAEVERTFAAYCTAVDAGMATAAGVLHAEPQSAAGLAAADLLLTRRFNDADGVAAMDAVANYHAADPAVAGIVARVGYYVQAPQAAGWPAAARLLDAVQAAAADHAVAGQVVMARARRAEVCLHVAEGLADHAAPLPWQDRMLAAVKSEIGGTLDADRLAGDAVGRLRTVVRDFGDLPDLHKPLAPHPQTLADDAAPQLFELEHLRVGMPAPDLAATDLAGRPYRLSDERGRVVLLVFWASWCGPCMAAIPHERELAGRFAGRPFAFVGVNGDEVREHGLAVARAERVPGRSFWNGPDGYFGPLARAWNVRGWPAVFLIDADGIIRAKDLGNAGSDDPIATLVAKAEKAGPTTRP